MKWQNMNTAKVIQPV